MLMTEHFPMLAGWSIRIEGTDIHAEVVARAQAGAYHRIEMNAGCRRDLLFATSIITARTGW